MERCSLNLIRVYFGEKHGKSHADALFRRLKAWMTYNIRTHKFVVTNAHDFYRYCKDHYKTPEVHGCQHYRVQFQFLHPSDVRRHQDCDLDQVVENTHKIYSVRNTSQPLQLKVHAVPCLCNSCITEIGDCLNADHTDAWKVIDLVPANGSNLRKYQKKKHPDAKLQEERQKNVTDAQSNNNAQNVDDPSEKPSDDELPNIHIDFDPEKDIKKHAKKTKNRNGQKMSKNCVTDAHVTDASVTDANVYRSDPHVEKQSSCSWVNVNEEIMVEDFVSNSDEQQEISDDVEIIEICECTSKEFEMTADNLFVQPHQTKITAQEIRNEEIPLWALWRSILASFDHCLDNLEMDNLARELKPVIPAMKERVVACFNSLVDTIDHVAQAEIPEDGPRILTAVYTKGDGNCLCRALSKAFFDTDEFSDEMRVRILMEAIIHKESYLSDNCLERGATFVHKNADLPTVFATFSEFYTPSQKFTHESVAAIYTMELHSCAKLNSYMGIWQLVQAASVLGTPIHTIYPVRGEYTIRNDFNCMFFPVDYITKPIDDDPIVIMWTGIHRGTVPVHFVPLLRKIE